MGHHLCAFSPPQRLALGLHLAVAFERLSVSAETLVERGLVDECQPAPARRPVGLGVGVGQDERLAVHNRRFAVAPEEEADVAEIG